MKFYLTQFRFFRKLYKGQWYLICNQVVNPYWVDHLDNYKSCGGFIAAKEYWGIRETTESNL